MAQVTSDRLGDRREMYNMSRGIIHTRLRRIMKPTDGGVILARATCVVSRVTLVRYARCRD